MRAKLLISLACVLCRVGSCRAPEPGRPGRGATLAAGRADPRQAVRRAFRQRLRPRREIFAPKTKRTICRVLRPVRHWTTFRIDAEPKGGNRSGE